ncbi:hypothetical protein ACJJTC_005348 [Scirpophaga incertulas]
MATELDRSVQQRRHARALFTKCGNKLETILNDVDKSRHAVSAAFENLKCKFESLSSLENSVYNQWLDLPERKEEEYESLMGATEDYVERWHLLQQMYNAYIKEEDAKTIVDSCATKNVKSSALKVINCIFCDSSSHISNECEDARKMSYDDRVKAVRIKNACRICLHIGHWHKYCRNRQIKCTKCSRRHYAIMHPAEPTKENETGKLQATLLQSSSATVILPTLGLNIIHKGKKLLIRALLDSGAQRSFLRREIADKLNLVSMGEVIISHNLFGGVVTKKENHSDNIVPLTPNDFIVPNKRRDPSNLDQIDLSTRAKRIVKLRDDFKTRFRNEYLSLLIHKQQKGSGNDNIIYPGDIVLVEIQNAKRVSWPLARVIEVFSGVDGHTRAARLRLQNSNEVVRPVQRLYALELRADEPAVSAQGPEDVDNLFG